MIETGCGFDEIRNDNYLHFAGRVKKLFFNACIMLTFDFLVILFLKGYSFVLLVSYLFLLILALVYAIISARNILYCLRFYHDQREIEIVIEKYSSKRSIILNKEEIIIRVSQDFSSKLRVWRLNITKKNGDNVLSQKDIAGWTKDTFLEIEKKYQKMFKLNEILLLCFSVLHHIGMFQ